VHVKEDDAVSVIPFTFYMHFPFTPVPYSPGNLTYLILVAAFTLLFV
jgi:hypothetical protein